MRTSVVGLGRWIVISSSIFCLSLVALAFVNSFWLALPVLAFAGFGAMKHMGATNTLIQTIVDDRMRGRVMSFYTMAFVGTMPMGSLIGGALAGRIGSHATLGIISALGLLGCLRFYQTLPELRKVLRPMYERMGILEPAA
jgi:MFS family permease